MVMCNCPVPEVDTSRVKPPFELNQIGSVYEEPDFVTLDMIKIIRDNITISDFDQQKGLGERIYWQAGSGKTTRLVELIQSAERPLVLCYTNKACSSIRERLQEGLHDVVHTFDSYFSDRKDGDLFLDEYSMIPNKWMNVVYDNFRKHNIRFVNRNVRRRQPDQSDRKPSHYLQLQQIRGNRPHVRTEN